MKRESLLFLAKAVVFTIIIYNVSEYLFLRRLVSDLVSRLLLFIGINAPSYFLEGELMLGDYIFSKNCVALSVISVIWGLLFSARGKIKEILFSVLSVFFVVSALNITRLVFTYYLLSRGVSFFWGHDVLANGSAIILAFLVFYLIDPIFPDFKRQVFDIIDDAQKDATTLARFFKAKL